MDFSEDGWGECDGGDIPVALDGGHVWPIGVAGFEPSPVFGEEGGGVVVGGRGLVAAGAEDESVIDHEVGAEEDAVLVFDEEISDGIGVMSADFGDSSGEVGHHIGVAVEGLIDPVEFFGVVGEVYGDEGGIGVSSDDAVEGLEEFFPRGEFVGVAEPPAFVVFEFFPSFVLVVVGEPEGSWVGDVDGDGHVEFAAAFPDGVKFWVVDADEFALGVAEVEAEAFELFESGGAEAMTQFDLFGGILGPVRGVPSGVVEDHVMDETSWVERVGQSFVGFEFGGLAIGSWGDGAGAEVGDDADADGVGDSDSASEVFGGEVDVLVEVDESAFGAPLVGLFFDVGEVLLGEGEVGVEEAEEEESENEGGGRHGRVLLWRRG